MYEYIIITKVIIYYRTDYGMNSLSGHIRIIFLYPDGYGDEMFGFEADDDTDNIIISIIP